MHISDVGEMLDHPLHCDLIVQRDDQDSVVPAVTKDLEYLLVKLNNVNGLI